jgi:hypothetical protein
LLLRGTGEELKEVASPQGGEENEDCDEREIGGGSGPGILVCGRGLIGHFSLLLITVYQ